MLAKLLPLMRRDVVALDLGVGPSGRQQLIRTTAAERWVFTLATNGELTAAMVARDSVELGRTEQFLRAACEAKGEPITQETGEILRQVLGEFSDEFSDRQIYKDVAAALETATGQRVPTRAQASGAGDTGFETSVGAAAITATLGR